MGGSFSYQARKTGTVTGLPWYKEKDLPESTGSSGPGVTETLFKEGHILRKRAPFHPSSSSTSSSGKKAGSGGFIASGQSSAATTTTTTSTGIVSPSETPDEIQVAWQEEVYEEDDGFGGWLEERPAWQWVLGLGVVSLGGYFLFRSVSK